MFSGQVEHRARFANSHWKEWSAAGVRVVDCGYHWRENEGGQGMSFGLELDSGAAQRPSLQFLCRINAGHKAFNHD
jgi:hypothetical protein